MTQERLFGASHAFDHPVAKWITIGIPGHTGDAGKVAAVQIVPASRGPSPVRHTPIPIARPTMAMTSNARRRVDSFMRCFPILIDARRFFASADSREFGFSASSEGTRPCRGNARTPLR